MMTVDEATRFLLSNKTRLGTSLNTIMVSDRALQEYPPDSVAYQAHKKILDAELEKVSEVATEYGYENAGVDPVLGKAACDCKPNEPCCMESGTVADGANGSRKVQWPSAAPPLRFEKNLLVIAKDISGRNLTSKVKVNWAGKNCSLGKPETPHIRTSGLLSGPERIAAKSQEVTVGIPFLPSFAVALERFFPRNVIMALATLDILFSIANGLDSADGASFTPSQCFTDAPTGGTLTVLPVPYLKLDGELMLAMQLIFSTAGVNGAVSAKGSLTGKFGNHDLSASAEAKSISGTGLSRSGQQKAPGMIGVMANIIGTMDEFVAKGNTKGSRTFDATKYASGITLSKSLALKPTGLDLTAKSGSPDLELKLAGLMMELKLGVTGRLDIIDALAMQFAGPGARAIREARDAMANGEHIKGKLDAYLELGAEGTLTHAIAKGVTITIPANLPAAESTNLSETFRGEIKIRGVLMVGIEIEAEIWIFSGKAGANGTVHTSWTWALRKQGNAREKNYKFEGLIVELKAHAEAGFRSGNDNAGGSAFGNKTASDAGASAAQDASDLETRVKRHLEKSSAKAEGLAKSGIASFSGGTTYTIFNPKDSGWEKY